jgi:transporter family protein
MKPGLFLLCMVAVISWGLWGSLARLAGEQVNQQVVIFYTILAQNIVLLIYLLMTGQLARLQGNPTGITLASISGVLSGVGLVCFYLALKSGKSSIVIPLTSIYPIVTVLFGLVVLHEQLSFTKILGIALAIAAVVLISTGE